MCKCLGKYKDDSFVQPLECKAVLGLRYRMPHLRMFMAERNQLEPITYFEMVCNEDNIEDIQRYLNICEAEIID